MCYSKRASNVIACAEQRKGPFVCDICGATYHNDEQNLELHKKFIHKICTSAEKEEEDHHHHNEEDHLVDGAFHVLGKSLRNLEAQDSKEDKEDGFDHGVVWRRYEPYRYGATKPKGRRGLPRWMSCAARTQQTRNGGFRAPSSSFWLV